ncbi:MAG: DUF721 domain-containing protein [Bacteroidota bacterium]|nr:DUF721 domain-containing protein [Bacteroidota bacterium]
MYKPVIRSGEVVSIADGIKHLFKTYHLENKYTQALVLVKWDELLGPGVVKRTEKIFFKQETMYVKLTSAPLKHHLSLKKSEIIEKLNNELNEKVISNIIFL